MSPTNRNSAKPESKTKENTEAKKANKTQEMVPAPAAAPQKSGSGFATTLAAFAFVLSSAAGYGIYWNWQQMMQEQNNSAETIAALRQQLETELQKSQQALKSELSSTKETIQSEVNQVAAAVKEELSSKSQAIESLSQQIESTTSEKITAAEAKLTSAQAELGKANHGIKETQKRQQSLEVSIDGLYSRMGNTSRDWVIAEADYLLKVANHRLQLEQDVTTSIQALTLADKRLNSLDDPALNEVRNVIAQELVSLETLPIPDQAGVSMQLTELQNQVDQLPLKGRERPVNSDTEVSAEDAMTVDNWQALPLAIADVLKGLVVISSDDRQVSLSPEQIKNIHENLKLKLEQARIVLLRGNQDLYDSNMKLAMEWAEKYFNTDEVVTKKFVDTVAYLKAKPVTLQTPDISSSLRTLRKVAKRLELNIPNAENNAKSELSDASSDLAMN